jgi:hypothetical protein
MKSMSILITATIVAVVSETLLLMPPAAIYAHDGVSDGHEGTHVSGALPAIEVEIVVREGGVAVLKGPQTQGHLIALTAGQPAILAFRNEDTVARQFASPLFTRADIHFAGRAIGIFRKDAVGFRMSPGSTLTLEFTTPYSGFPKMYDLIFWCTQDNDKQPDTALQEMLIVMTQEP